MAAVAERPVLGLLAVAKPNVPVLGRDVLHGSGFDDALQLTERDRAEGNFSQMS